MLKRERAISERIAGDFFVRTFKMMLIPELVLVGVTKPTPKHAFPTGSVMPVGRRYQLLEWAKENHSFILEDDYDSELRYFGKPVPALQGLDDSGRVVYLGSFSSTLFPAVKISYMVLPESMMEIFNTIKTDSYLAKSKRYISSFSTM